MSMERKEKLIYWLIVPLVAAAIPVMLGWQTIARLSGWAPISECPGTPVVLTISSPGDGVKVPFENRHKSYRLYNTTFVVETSRPISDEYDIGLLTKGEKDDQYHLVFWWGETRPTSTRVRKDSVDIPWDNAQPNHAEVRAVLVDSYKGFGEYYAELSQVTNNKSLIAISEPIVVNFEK
jgi:hypothetical protein